MPQGSFPREWPRVPPADAAAAQVPEGYRVEVVVRDLEYPTSVEMDPAGNLYVAEAGFAYGDPVAPARILRVAPDGAMAYVADQLNGPITDLLWHDGRMYISHFGKVSRLDPDGSVVDLVTDLPASSGHQNNQLTIGPDGKLYFGMGTVTNSGVVGLDEAYPFLALLLWPELHDVPAQDIRLKGRDYVNPNPDNVLAKQGVLVKTGRILAQFAASLLHKEHPKSLLSKTGAFQPFGENDDKTIEGQVKANGTILRMNLDGSDLEVYAWGLRNPFGVLWGPDGVLYATENGFDERGSRPIANAEDNVWVIRQGAWYGWPDYSSGIPVTDERFRSERGKKVKFLMKEHPPVETPLLTRPKHAALTKLDFSTSAAFGFEGQMFLAEVGSGAPITGPDEKPVGFQVVRIDVATKEVQPFFSARESALGPPGPLQYVVTPAPKRLVDVRFSPDGSALYIADIGGMTAFEAGAGPFPRPFPTSGTIWRVTRADAPPASPPANLSPLPPRATLGAAPPAGTSP